MNGIRDRIVNEPVLTLALVQAALVCAGTFGLDLDGRQTAGLVTFTAAVLSWLARSQVTPTVKIRRRNRPLHADRNV